MLLFIKEQSAEQIYSELFQNISCYCLSSSLAFDTSNLWISKHLMLLFIPLRTLSIAVTIAFQNISCYCLSLCMGGVWICNFISKHLMLLFIPRISAFLVSPLPFFPLYFLYFSIFYQPTPLSWTALLIIP